MEYNVFTIHGGLQSTCLCHVPLSCYTIHNIQYAIYNTQYTIRDTHRLLLDMWCSLLQDYCIVSTQHPTVWAQYKYVDHGSSTC